MDTTDKTYIEAVRYWESAAVGAADAQMKADICLHDAIVKSQKPNDTQRVSDAKLRAADLIRQARLAETKAQAARFIVEHMLARSK